MNSKILCGLVITFFAAAGINAQEPTEYKLNQGDQFKVSVSIKQDIIQQMLGQEMKTTQNIRTTDLYEVVEVKTSGYRLKVTGLSRSLDSSGPQGDISVDSDLSGDDHLAFRVMTKKSFFIEMNKYGKALSVDGLDQVGTEIRGELKNTMLEGSADQILSAYNSETLTTAFDGQFYIYQEPGMNWSRESKMTVNNLPINVEYNFKRTSTTEITCSGDMSLTGELEVMGQAMTADLSGNQSSIFSVEPGTGLSKSIKTTQNLEGGLDVQDIKIPMTLKTEIQVTIVK